MFTTLPRPELTTADRCDRCGAAARVRVILPSGGELLFCGHHSRQYQGKLRELFTKQPSSPPRDTGNHG